ncbi:hypothetical protein BOX15_Mlig034177g1, partial [Macrostomum lignano]
IAITCLEDSFDSLSNAIAKETNVPVENQKLIYKGKSLQPGSSLSQQGLSPGCKLMLIGSCEEVARPEAFAALDAVDREVKAMEAKLDDLNSEYAGFSNGFTPQNLRRQAAQSLSKRLLAFNDRGERGLERLDGLSLGDAAATSRVRARRKDLADRLQAMLNISDSLLQDLLRMAEEAGFSLD